MKKLLVLTLLLTQLTLIIAQNITKRDILQKEFSSFDFKESLLPIEEWVPCPTISGREYWESISEEKKKLFIKKSEELSGKNWTPLTATMYLEYSINGNRSNFQTPNFNRLKRLYTHVVAELIENKGRFIDDIVNGVWAICEETSWCLPAHNKSQSNPEDLPDIRNHTPDLTAGDKAAGLSWIYYLMKDKLDSVSPVICQRIKYEVYERIIEPVYIRTDLIWMGYIDIGRPPNNWNPWVTSNYLNCVYLLEEDKDKITEYTRKGLELIDMFIDGYGDDGGCDEGPSYWGHAGGKLLDALDLLKMVTGGKFNVYDEEVIENIGMYIPAMHIDENKFVNFADASPTVPHTKYKSLLLKYGQETNNDKLIKLASYFNTLEESKTNIFRIFGLRLFRELNQQNNNEYPEFSGSAFSLFYWMPSIQVMTARENDKSAKGLFIAAQGGHNAESHNHNDVGNFIVYEDGEPLLIDVGVGTYTRKTFSPERYSIWTMQSQYHNCPTINGVMQQAGREFKATNVSCINTKNEVKLSLDISKSYPDSAFVDSWQRTIVLERGKTISITDNYSLSKTLELTQWNFMAKARPTISKPGVISFENRTHTLCFDADLFDVEIETIELEDGNLNKNWGNTIYRILITRKNKVKTETCSFLIK